MTDKLPPLPSMIPDGTPLAHAVREYARTAIDAELIRLGYDLPPPPAPASGEKVYLGHGNYEEIAYFTEDQLRSYAAEAVRLEREAILQAVDDLEEPAWYGYENPNNFDDGKRAALAAIRARSEVIDDSASPIN